MQSSSDRPLLSLRGAAFIGGALFLAHTAALVIVRNNSALRPLVGDSLSSVESLLAALALYYAARQSRKASVNRQRAHGWLLLAAAEGVSTLGNLIWLAVEVMLRDSNLLFVAHACYAVSYLLVMAGLVLVRGMPMPWFAPDRRRWLLDMGIVIFSGLLFFWVLLLAPTLAQASPDGPRVIFMVGAALGDLVMVGILLSALSSPDRGASLRPLWLLLVTTLFWSAADVLFARQVLLGTYVGGDLLDLAWAAGDVVLVLASAAQAQLCHTVRRPSQQYTAGARWIAPLSYASLLAVYALLLYSRQNGAANFSAVALGVGIVILLVLARQVLAVKENRTLYELAQQEIAERRRVENAEHQQRVLAEALRDAAAALTASLALDTVIERILETVGRVVKHDCANVMLIEGDLARVVAGHGYDESQAQAIASLRFEIEQMASLREMRATGRPLAVPDTLAYDTWRITPETAWVRSYAGSPIVLRGQVIGFLNLDSTTPGFFCQDDAERLRAFADQSAIAIENARLFAQVEEERAMLALRVEERTAELHQAAERLARRGEELSQIADQLRAANAGLAQAARMKDEFVASLSHELRTPLNALLVHAQTLGEGIYGELSARQARSVRAIEESGQRLLVLINDLLDLAKIGAGKLELLFDTIDVRQLCRSCLTVIGDDARRKQIEVRMYIDPDLAWIEGDTRRLRQILGNLLDNAVKFTPEGGTIGLEVKNDLEHRQALFAVWDTGIGIAPEDKSRLFQQFVQLDGRRTRRYEGSGLGLVLAYRLAEMHGGRIWIESELGRGSRFTVVLPLQSTPAAQEAPAGALGPAERA